MQSPQPRPRFELKYRISESLACSIEEAAGYHLTLDKHSCDGEYPVNSLYFDTPDDEDARETDEGVVLRSKVRLRCYAAQPQGPFFLELKQRYGASVYKTRALLEPDDAERIAEGEAPVAAYSGQGNADALDTIRSVIDSREMTPRVWVKYTRVAWTSPWGDGVRVTFDRALETQSAEISAQLSPSDSAWSFPELDDRVVLELKFFEAGPGWMQRLAHDFELRRTSCSKYGKCWACVEGATALPRLVAAG